MAQKVTVSLEDDLTGGPAKQTVRFAFDGTDYEIDLNKKRKVEQQAGDERGERHLIKRNLEEFRHDKCSNAHDWRHHLAACRARP